MDGKTAASTGDGLDAERLLSAAAHDLKAPLLTIQAYASGLESAARQQDWDGFRADTQRIQALCQSLGHLLDDVRELARQGEPLRKTTVVALDGVVHDALERLAGVRPANLELIAAVPLPRVRGAPERLVRVFQNILENAFRAVREVPHPRIEISSEVSATELIVTIRDNGRGMQPEEIPRIFQPYRQLGGSAGTCGLGMPIAQRIVQVHGGDLTLESQGEGTGVTARIRLPQGIVVNS